MTAFSSPGYEQAASNATCGSAICLDELRNSEKIDLVMHRWAMNVDKNVDKFGELSQFAARRDLVADGRGLGRKYYGMTSGRLAQKEPRRRGLKMCSSATSRLGARQPQSTENRLGPHL